DLWPPHDIDKGHRWGMTIDLNKCIGCAACVVSCTAENNVPVVGKDEVRRNREMHWLRIDRYFSSDADPENIFEHGGERNYDAMEVPSAYPEVAHQPVMCQHCNHAPCETVCPVAATNHSLEGLNQMAYNRCIGTRYCANNCPYKVRRFNWFNYTAYKKFTEVNPSQNDLGRMVLNPDVVVRTRGVMEKCSLCVQRIQEGKLKAKKERHPVEDGAIQTACSSVCPTNAITFGDLNNEKSQVRTNAQHNRSYHLLEEVGIQPNIWYMTKVRNTEKTIVMKHEEENGHKQEEVEHS
ncbi:MAG: 4Fe-4S dicluster domain-containing protein, partial [Bacteroidetes bacterium]